MAETQRLRNIHEECELQHDSPLRNHWRTTAAVWHPRDVVAQDSIKKYDESRRQDTYLGYCLLWFMVRRNVGYEQENPDGGFGVLG